MVDQQVEVESWSRVVSDVATNWEPFELLSYTGIAVAVFFSVSVIVSVFVETLGGHARTSAPASQIILNATDWSNFVAMILLVVAALSWWEARRWHDDGFARWSQGGTNDTVGSDDEGGEDAAYEEGSDAASVHLERIRVIVAILDWLFLVTAAAGVARPVAVLIQPYHYDTMASDLILNIGAALIALAVAVAGIWVVFRTTRLCVGWGYVESLDDTDDEEP